MTQKAKSSKNTTSKKTVSKKPARKTTAKTAKATPVVPPAKSNIELFLEEVLPEGENYAYYRVDPSPEQLKDYQALVGAHAMGLLEILKRVLRSSEIDEVHALVQPILERLEPRHRCLREIAEKHGIGDPVSVLTHSKYYVIPRISSHKDIVEIWRNHPA